LICVYLCFVSFPGQRKTCQPYGRGYRPRFVDQKAVGHGNRCPYMDGKID